MIRFPDGTLRYMTVHEAKLIQTFPPDYIICGGWGEAMRQIGNAVPVKLAEQMGRSIVNALGGIQAPVAKYSFHRPRTEQLRLAIEPKNMRYKGAAKGKTKAAKIAAPKKGVAKRPAAKRPKSAKTRYAKRG